MGGAISAGAAATGEYPVVLNVYDLTPLNNYVHWCGLGIFHSAVEVHGSEYSFGAHDLPTSGVFEVEPKSCPGFLYRSSIFIGRTSLHPLEFRDFIQRMASEYHGDTYHLISKNCNHFTDDLSTRLTGKPIPGWVNRLAKLEVSMFYVPTASERLQDRGDPIGRDLTAGQMRPSGWRLDRYERPGGSRSVSSGTRSAAATSPTGSWARRRKQQPDQRKHGGGGDEKRIKHELRVLKKPRLKYHVRNMQLVFPGGHRPLYIHVQVLFATAFYQKVCGWSQLRQRISRTTISLMIPT